MCAKKKSDRRGIVYSTSDEFNYEHEGEEESETLAPSQQNLFIHLDKQNRKGKVVSLVERFIGTSDDLNELGKMLKSKCGVGGSVKDGMIIIQGDRREQMGEILEELGYKVKVR